MAAVLSLSPEWFAARMTPFVKSVAVRLQQTTIASASSATHPRPSVSNSYGPGRPRVPALSRQRLRPLAVDPAADLRIRRTQTRLKCVTAKERCDRYSQVSGREDD